MKDAAEHLVNKGTKRFHLHESDCGTTNEVDEGFMVYKADEYEALWEWGLYVDTQEDKKVDKVKSALADGNIALIGMRVPPSFGSGVNENGEWIKSERSSENEGGGGHAMCVIGYDDNRLVHSLCGITATEMKESQNSKIVFFCNAIHIYCINLHLFPMLSHDVSGKSFKVLGQRILGSNICIAFQGIHRFPVAVTDKFP